MCWSISQSQLLEKHLPQAWHSATVFRKKDVSLTFWNGKRGGGEEMEKEFLNI